mmetsp:Transcript_72627/g.188946  ORF Transcript_72627/g.188946 Transcript_72627/m.188946 type:complete len:172 (-) Transcript_72627:70-585(-)
MADASGRLKEPNFTSTIGSNGQSPRTPLKGAAADATIESQARQKAEAGRLRFPEFEWYLGPMYKRYGDILAERARANTQQVVKKKVTYTVPPEPPWMKHTKPKHITHSFPLVEHERPLTNAYKAYTTKGTSPRTPRGGTSSGGQTQRLRDAGANSTGQSSRRPEDPPLTAR